MGFLQRLSAAWRRNDSLLCVGLDPEPERIPRHLRDRSDAIFQFCSRIVDTTADLVCAFKPQIAHFAANRAEAQLEDLIAHIHRRHPDIPVILDAKRGDIGSTASHYMHEAFDRYGADAVTLNPYLGGDALEPFLERRERGVILLCRTSNPGARDVQDLPVEGRPLYLHIAEQACRRWNRHGNCALVVGATYPDELARVRGTVGSMPLLVPGIGAQGGDIEAVVRNGRDDHQEGLIISSSRAVLYASDGEDFAAAARTIALRTREAINAARREC